MKAFGLLVFTCCFLACSVSKISEQKIMKEPDLFSIYHLENIDSLIIKSDSNLENFFSEQFSFKLDSVPNIETHTFQIDSLLMNPVTILSPSPSTNYNRTTGADGLDYFLWVKKPNEAYKIPTVKPESLDPIPNKNPAPKDPSAHKLP